MAAEIITVLGTPIIEKIAKEASSRLNAAYRVNRDIESLERSLSAITATFKDNEKRSGVGFQNLIQWLKELRELVFDADDILETYAAEAALRKIKNRPAPIDMLCSRLNAARSLKKIQFNLDEIYKTRKMYQMRPEETNGIEPSGLSQMRINSPGGSQENRIKGRDVEKNEITDKLCQEQPSNFPVIVINGMGGLGKTAFAGLVYNDVQVKEKFNSFVWVDVTAQFNLYTLLKKIAQQLKVKGANDYFEVTLGPMIIEALNGQTLLLVLDDVWCNEQLNWEGLQTAVLNSLPTGSKVLVTSRDDKLVYRLGNAYRYVLKFLPEDVCCALFEEEVSRGDTNELEDEKKELVKDFTRKCKSLPLAVKAIAATLRGRDLEYWKRQSKNEIWAVDRQQPDEPSSIEPALILSFQDLPSILKVCFSFCSLYPKSHKFDKHQLVKLWIAEGYILPPERGVFDTLEQLGGDYFDKLHSRTFFQLSPNEEENYIMHDLIHDLAIQVSLPSQQVHIKADQIVSIQKTCRHVSFTGENNVSQTTVVNQLLKAKKVRTLLQPHSGTIDFGKALNKIFKTLRYMRVVDLSSTNITSLPKSIKHLKLLHYLDLSRTKVRSLRSSVCKLLNLQILKLLGCTELEELPNNFGNLKALRHLELDETFWANSSKLPPRLGGLHNLHDLHRFHVHRESGYGIEELKSMNCLQGLLHISKLENAGLSAEAKLCEKTGITKLILEWSNEDAGTQDPTSREENVLEDLQPHQGLQELHIEKYKGTKFSNWMGVEVLKNFKTLHKISLRHCVSCKTLSLGPLPNLGQLIMKRMSALEEWPENTAFGSMKKLTISDCPMLQKLPCSSFPSVEVMKIKQCDALEALPHVPKLTALKIINNKLLQHWREDHQQFDGRLLQELKMMNCPSLEMLPQNFTPRSLKIRGSRSEPFTDTPEAVEELPYLEVDDHNGPRLVEGLRFLSVSGCQNLVTFPEDALPTSIERLVIKNCSGLQQLHGEATSINNLSMLTSLQEVTLEDCPMLESLPERLPDSFRYFYIRRCPLLKQKYSCGEIGETNNQMSSKINFSPVTNTFQAEEPSTCCFNFT